jgi:YafQ family addiction module toxin component
LYELFIMPSVEKVFHKLSKKDQKQLRMIRDKIEEIRMDPQRYKNLRSPMNHLKRVHVDSSFVIVFSVDEARHLVVIEDYDHHDNIYG